MNKKEELFSRYPALSICEDSLDRALSKMEKTYKSGGVLYTCGNGGSCSDSDHIVGELMKGFLSRRPILPEEKEKLSALFPDVPAIETKFQRAIPAVSLTAQSAILSAFANDVDADFMYAQLAFGYMRPNDLLIGLSTSGNSVNVVNAVKAAKMRGAGTVAMTGEKESRLSELCDVTIRVPERETFKIQELHLPVYHYLCAALEEKLFG